MSAGNGRTWWRAVLRRGTAGEPDEPVVPLVVDPTRTLLAEVNGLNTHLLSFPVAMLLIVLLWLPTLVDLGAEPLGPSELDRITRASSTAVVGHGESMFDRVLTRTSCELQGIATKPGDARPVLGPSERRLLRLPSAIASLCGLLVFFVLGRRIVGDASALLGALLLGSSGPWLAAARSAESLLLAETLALAGVAWVVALWDRHREVAFAGRTAMEVGFAGVFFGVALLLAPATYPTFLATLLIWLSLGLRRSTAATLRVKSPARVTLFTLLGAVLLLGVTVATARILERLVGGTGPPLGVDLAAALASSGEIWAATYRTLVSPGFATDGLTVLVLFVILVVAVLERLGGHPWRAGGIVPWVFLGLFTLALGRAGAAGPGLSVPLSAPPLLLLGIGWLVLRGFVTGRVRRQEYTFLSAWVGVGILLLPVIAGIERFAPHRAAMVTILPCLLLVAGRGAISLWEAETNPLARTGILLFAFLPVLAGTIARLAAHPTTAGALAGLASWTVAVLPVMLVVAAGLGVLAVFVTVRPDLTTETPSRATSRRRGGRGRGRSRSGQAVSRRRRR